MKETPEQKVQNDILLPGKFSGEGFLGDDNRHLAEIIQDDLTVVERLGFTPQELAERMRALTEAGKTGLGRPVDVDGKIAVTVSDDRGTIPCPFSDNYRTTKQTTQATNLKSGLTLRWSDLNIHMIGEHCFFEGLGSPFRIDPDQLVELIR